jgi:enamine deaminase RidA (YjgF/YER057c/UK114 family)
MRTNFASESKWEPLVGYSRAVRMGDFVFVSGTTAFDEHGVMVGLGNAYEQAMQCFRNIERALAQAGATMRDVVRTRMYVTNITMAMEVGRAHAAFFADIRPAATMVEITRLVDPAMLVEIEADAMILRPEH